MKRLRPVAALLLVLAGGAACAPAYQPRAVPIPAGCEERVRVAAERGVATLSEAEMRQLTFCQQQLILRAVEEDAAYARHRVETDRIAAWLSLASTIAASIFLVANNGS